MTNGHALALTKLEMGKVFRTTHGSAVYPFCSLLNHSCAPNILRVSTGSRTVLVALRVVEIGEQLFDNYGFVWY